MYQHHYIYNGILLGCNILDILPATFYPVRSRPIHGTSEWLQLLKKLGLLKYVCNNDIMPSQDLNDPFWYYMGELE